MAELVGQSYIFALAPVEKPWRVRLPRLVHVAVYVVAPIVKVDDASPGPEAPPPEEPSMQPLTDWLADGTPPA